MNQQHIREELLEMFYEDGTPMGMGVSRSRAHAEGIMHGASHIFICKKENGKIKVLLQRRSLGKDSFPGCLDTSSAGHIDYGSDFMETALREMQEELGISVSAQQLTELFMQKVDITSVFRGKTFIDCEVNKVYLYVPEAEPDFRIQQEELSEVVWMDMDEVLQKVRRCDPEYCLEAEEFEKVVQRVNELMKSGFQGKESE